MTIPTCKEEFPSWPRRTDVCLLSDPGEQVQHRHRFLKESRVGGGVRTIVGIIWCLGNRDNSLPWSTSSC